MNESPTTNRRGLLLASASTVSAGVASALTYKFRKPLETLRSSFYAKPQEVEPHIEMVNQMEFAEAQKKLFTQNQRALYIEQGEQTRELINSLRKKYSSEVMGKFYVWDLIEKLAFVYDPTDGALPGVSQWLHVQQCLKIMDDESASDDLLLIAMLHDLGKIYLLTEEGPENVVLPVNRIEGEEIGLAKNLYQFGHGELIYSRIKDHVPEHIAWTVRFHTINASKEEHLMSATDMRYYEEYLKPFRRYDAEFKSPYFIPKLKMDRFRDLVYQHFPNPILF